MLRRALDFEEHHYEHVRSTLNPSGELQLPEGKARSELFQITLM